MARRCNDNLRQALDLSDRMIRMADRAFEGGVDEESRQLLGLVWEMAMKLRSRVEKECERHRASGGWD